MPRTARVVAANLPHHVTQRGNHGLDVFYSDRDRQQYLIWLAEYAELHGLRVWSNCLMSNHIHLVAVPGGTDTLAQVLRSLHMRHTQSINAQHGWTGHLWQARYFSCPLDDDHLRTAIRYVELNPVRAGLVTDPLDFEWSSARPHCRLRPDPALATDLPLLNAVKDWHTWLQEPLGEDALALLRDRTQRGLPCGGDEFIKAVSESTGRVLVDRGRGRPRKEHQTSFV